LRFNDQTRGEILGAIRIGVSHERAALSADVSGRQLRRWLSRGRNDIAGGRNTAYSRFVDAMNKAESDALGQVESVFPSY